jgi:hypothetical protein
MTDVLTNPDYDDKNPEASQAYKREGVGSRTSTDSRTRHICHKVHKVHKVHKADETQNPKTLKP